MKLDNFLNKKIKITQVKSGSKLKDKQNKNLIGLGLRGIGSSAELKVDGSILGMIKKVYHLIKIS
ncbi:MAG: 50S ribosomal protein L30 [Proteobacteria bacterium]|nr:50S ribosomal protein L30 [Pseudomonadota bacterium]NCA27771.1 50S ribosomal protein L30 [Pseudomonadota bacterium]